MGSRSARRSRASGRAATGCSGEFWRAPHLLSTLVDRHEASAEPLDGLYRDQKVSIADPQMPTDRDVQKAHLPVGLVDQKVPHVADNVVVGIGDGTVDQVAA